MNKHTKRTTFLLLPAAIFIFVSASLAFAHRDPGYGYSPGMHYGQGKHHRGAGGFADLSEDQVRKLDAEHTAFREATKELRQQIYQKRLELASELAKQNPDAATAAARQREISDFLAQLAQRRLEHFMRVQKINPDAGRGGPMGFGMMGNHMPHRDMMGPGGYGPRDCPWSGNRRDYGAGAHMMGPGYGSRPGMMGPGQDRGMGPGMMSPDDEVDPAEKQAGTGEES